MQTIRLTAEVNGERVTMIVTPKSVPELREELMDFVWAAIAMARKETRKDEHLR